MVSVGLLYGRLINAVLNAQRCHYKILRPILVPFIHHHRRVLQHYNTRPHVAGICIQFLKAEDISVMGIKKRLYPYIFIKL